MFQNPPLKGRIMKITGTKSFAIAAMAIALTASTNMSPAFAIPDPGETGAPTTIRQTDAPCSVATDSGSRRLERIGTQFVRGDDLTGAGVLAPGWVPEAQ